MGMRLETTVMYDTPVTNHDTHTKEIRPADIAEEALIARAVSGEVEAFEELVRRYRNDVFALSFHFVRNREDAWDLAQEVFVKAFRSIGRFRGQASFKTWLLRITANHCKDFFKKRRLSTVPFEEVAQNQTPSGALGPSDQALAGELGIALQQAIDQLPEKHRTAFILREFEDLSYEEMAETMGCSIGTVMSRLHHARKKLQQTLIQNGIVEG